jgi:hypothetical protein
MSPSGHFRRLSGFSLMSAPHLIASRLAAIRVFRLCATNRHRFRSRGHRAPPALTVTAAAMKKLRAQRAVRAAKGRLDAAANPACNSARRGGVVKVMAQSPKRSLRARRNRLHADAQDAEPTAPLRRCGEGSFASMRSARFSGACPLLPESDSQPPKCVTSLRANTAAYQ